MHSSRMRTGRLLTVSHSIPCVWWGVCPPGGQMPLDADPPRHVTCDTCWKATLPPVDRRNDTPAKTLLRLRAVIKHSD